MRAQFLSTAHLHVFTRIGCVGSRIPESNSLLFFRKKFYREKTTDGREREPIRVKRMQERFRRIRSVYTKGFYPPPPPPSPYLIYETESIYIQSEKRVGGLYY